MPAMGYIVVRSIAALTISARSSCDEPIANGKKSSYANQAIKKESYYVH
jgi:hypothetical protein